MTKKPLILLSAALILAVIFVYWMSPALRQSFSDENSGKAFAADSLEKAEAGSRDRSGSQFPVDNSHKPASESGDKFQVNWNNLPATVKVIKCTTDALPTGDRAEALIQTGDQCLQLQPNQVGQFEQITVAPKSKLKIELAYPDGQVGDVIALEAEDGGIINGKGIAASAQLDSNHQLQFNFDVNEEEGIYRVAARKGGDVKMLAFWVSAHQ